MHTIRASTRNDENNPAKKSICPDDSSYVQSQKHMRKSSQHPSAQRREAASATKKYNASSGPVAQKTLFLIKRASSIVSIESRKECDSTKQTSIKESKIPGSPDHDQNKGRMSVSSLLNWNSFESEIKPRTVSMQKRYPVEHRMEDLDTSDLPTEYVHFPLERPTFLLHSLLVFSSKEFGKCLTS